jgi:hypothetical protein
MRRRDVSRLGINPCRTPAQRRADATRMGRQHVRDEMIHGRERKTGATLTIPIHADLRERNLANLVSGLPIRGANPLKYHTHISCISVEAKL